ncbi:hypothetical protein MUK42_34998 [Musa troglodytarum]|uniref:Uncharacterized protein n=1 Tax=Musa troglodytarum TaxID=320322 RepID=A0A9E7JCI8_9LILI|nr:hypothetical protein MUK42_34998 [Musa troglodytarum]
MCKMESACRSLMDHEKTKMERIEGHGGGQRELAKPNCRHVHDHHCNHPKFQTEENVNSKVKIT